MASYVVPQVEIHQLFSELPVALATTQVPFVFGPNYLLHRYDISSEKLGTFFMNYTGGTGKFAPYPGAHDEEAVEQTYTKLFGDNVFVKMGTFQNVVLATDDKGTSSSSDDTKIPNELDITEDESSDPDSSEIAVGRVLRLHIGSNTRDVKIIKIVEDGTSGDTTRVMIDEDLPVDTTISKADLCEVLDGVEFPREDFSDSSNKRNFFWKEAKDTTSGSATYGHYGIKIEHTLKAYYTDSDYKKRTVNYGDVLSADLYLTYRELLTSYSDTLHSLTGATDVATTLGAISPDNPLAQAVYNAALNAGGQTIRFMAIPKADLTGSDPDADIEGYSHVLERAELTKEVYFLVPVTRSKAILTLVKGHVEAMSKETVKRWRIGFISAEIPDEDPKYTSANNTSGEDFLAKTISVDTVNKTADVEVGTYAGSAWTESTVTQFKKDLSADDVIHYTAFDRWGKKGLEKFTVIRVLSNARVRVADPESLLSADEATFAGRKIEVYHPYTNAEKAEVIRDLSSSFATRRLYNVFPSVFTTGGVQMTGEFAAACVAGLVSSCLPQQPITNLELTGIDDIPLVYQTFSYDQLNTMASGGTFIVMQDLPNDQVYVRHQISTAYEDNNLNTTELSITKNLDSISYFFDDLLSPYIGKYNITPEMIMTLRNVVNSGITSLTSNSYGLYGSQLIADGTEILLIEQDALLKDHVNCNLQLNMPYPLNHLVLKLFV